ncbi:MAG: hypothetical protein PHF86_06670 [Candidatus Nanoarchaeia archaeon]|jgi:hypothetical protein|nr:hypothetical protein [Candidatus Nanoarchaeia archaeon]
MKKQVQKIANEILKEAADRTRKIRINVVLDRPSSLLFQKTIRAAPGFSNFVGRPNISIVLDILMNMEVTNERTLKNELKRRLSRLRNMRFEVL